MTVPMRRRPARSSRRSELLYSSARRGRHSGRASQCVLCTARSGVVLIRSARTCDEDIDKASGAGLPSGESSGVKDADERPNEVIGICVRVEVAAGDGASHRRYEGCMDKRTGAFEETCGIAGDAIHGWDDKALCGDMVYEEKHPGSERFERRHRVGEALFS